MSKPLSGPLASLSDDLFELLVGPSIMHLATRDAALQPMSVLAFGLRIDPDGREATVFLPVRLSELPLRNLRDNGQMALSVVRPTTVRALQLKGVWMGERRTGEDDRLFLADYFEALTQELGMVGVPRSIWRRLLWWPSMALRMELRDVFVQTPGPSAGAPCGKLAAAS